MAPNLETVIINPISKKTIIEESQKYLFLCICYNCKIGGCTQENIVPFNKSETRILRLNNELDTDYS